jgi:hypothetical protein
MSKQDLRLLASLFRTDLASHVPPAGGYVMIYNGVPYAWSECPRPADQKPGAIAVPSEGPMLKAVGGNDQSGAAFLVELPVEPTLADLPGKPKPTILAKADRQRWAAFRLSDRAEDFARREDYTRAFRCQRASMRCTTLSRRAFRTAISTARAAA